MALSPSLGWFTVCAACMGLCLSIYHPAGTSLISHGAAGSGRVFAIHGMAGNLGVASATLIAGVLGATLGWRWGLGLLAVVGLCLGLRVLALDVRATRELQRMPGKSRWSSFLLLLVAGSSMGMVYRGVTTFLPKFFAVSQGSGSHAGTAVGGVLTTAALLTGLVGMYVAGRMAGAGAPPARLFLIGAGLQAPLLLAIGLAGGKLLLPLAMAFAFFHFFTQPSSNYMVADFTPPPLRGLGYGLFFFTSFGFGSIGAALGGWASERAGLAASFAVLSVLLLPALVALVALQGRPASARDREQGAFGT
jgi:MFS family permease